MPAALRSGRHTLRAAGTGSTEGRPVRMTDIDPQADIELHTADAHVTVRVPLAGVVTGEWLRCYQQLALATQVPVQAQAHDERAWIVVNLPASSDQGEIAATMDAARALLAEADAAAERPPATAKAEASVRDWWASRGGEALPAGLYLGSWPPGQGQRNAGRWPSRWFWRWPCRSYSRPGSASVRPGQSRRWRCCCW